MEEKHKNVKDSNQERFVIVDGNHLIHRAFYAIQAKLTDPSGQPINAVYGFFSMLLNIIEAEKPGHIAMTFDEKAPTFRHIAHEGYKATRSKAPDELYVQIPRIRELVKTFNMPIYVKEGFEADDMMGTLAKIAEEDGLVTNIVTGDMDLLQLITPNIYVTFPHKGYREPTMYNKEGVIKKYGITPGQVVDYKSLVGDSSDNIKGVQGVGPKSAEKLLNDYKTLDGIYEHLDEITGAVHGRLKGSKEDAYFSQMLARIVTDVPCDYKMNDALSDRLDFLALSRSFEEMNMRSLMNRLKRMLPGDKQVGKEQMSMF